MTTKLMDPVFIPPCSGAHLATVCRDLTPALLKVLHPDSLTFTVEQWEAETSEKWTYSWPGERLGPNTTAQRTAVLSTLEAVEAEATVTIETIRWSEYDIAFVEVKAYWHVGDLRASCWARGIGLNPISEAYLRGPTDVIDCILTALVHVP
jgi:hypothetical protein